MKLWKWVLGVLALLGGTAAIASTQNKKKKEYDKKVKKNQAKVKEVKAKTENVQKQKTETLVPRLYHQIHKSEHCKVMG